MSLYFGTKLHHVTDERWLIEHRSVTCNTRSYWDFRAHRPYVIYRPYPRIFIFMQYAQFIRHRSQIRLPIPSRRGGLRDRAGMSLEPTTRAWLREVADASAPNHSATICHLTNVCTEIYLATSSLRPFFAFLRLKSFFIVNIRAKHSCLIFRSFKAYRHSAKRAMVLPKIQA